MTSTSCASCHRDPHRPSFGAGCAGCHTETAWRTQKIDHSLTDFPLRGLHARVECVACHPRSAVQVAVDADRCVSCHQDVHEGSFPGEDCAACHDESGFAGAPFDHTATSFELTGAHEGLECRSCHAVPAPLASSRVRPSVVSFTGLDTACISCHTDPHARELGATCESCHSTETFEVSAYTHSARSSFFEGQHASVSCEGCHEQEPLTAPVRTAASLTVPFAAASRTCSACHEDPHLGQMSAACESCHAVEDVGFAVADFGHSETAFPLTGSHATTECDACHKRETGVFPSGTGTAVRLKGLARECRACHQDVHLGQLDQACESCHDTSRFALDHYTHRRGSRDGFFTGSHARASCESCHQPVSANFPAGQGTAVKFLQEMRCVSCHEDRHRGALGPRCEECHRP
jgi:hypothetical protein